MARVRAVSLVLISSVVLWLSLDVEVDAIRAKSRVAGNKMTGSTARQIRRADGAASGDSLPASFSGGSQSSGELRRSPTYAHEVDCLLKKLEEEVAKNSSKVTSNTVLLVKDWCITSGAANLEEVQESMDDINGPTRVEAGLGAGRIRYLKLNQDEIAEILRLIPEARTEYASAEELDRQWREGHRTAGDP